MERDNRYLSVKVLVENGHINTFKQVVDFIPKSTIYRDMGINYARFVRCMASPRLFTIREIEILSSLLHVPTNKLLELIYNEQSSLSRTEY